LAATFGPFENQVSDSNNLDPANSRQISEMRFSHTPNSQKSHADRFLILHNDSSLIRFLNLEFPTQVT
jgi:hypothetical protein